MTAPTLTQPQLHSLLDILSHDEMYAEIQDFRRPGTLASYGPPFSTDSKSTSPSLQALFSRFILTLPGLKNVAQDYWKIRVSSLVEELEKAELSESYDKGGIGMRKTVSTALSSLIEYPARGVQAGFDPPAGGKGRDDQYDLKKAEDLQHSFRVVAKLLIYDDILDELVEKVAATDRLEDHIGLVQAVHECILVNLASFMHYTLIMSPKGQGLLRLVDQTNKMVPYAIVKSTLKIGNVATMISSMLKVVLAKVSLSTVTNWVGWTKDADEGMNLLQTIISAVLGWDSREFKSRVSKIEKSKEAPSKEQLAELKAYLSKSREEHASIREFSEKESKSIAFAILSGSSVSTDMTEKQHTLALDYLAAHLAIRDRERIVQVLCRSTPDHLTQAIRDVVAAYDPIIRNLHNAVDLSDTVNDCERFINDTIKLAKLPSPGSRDANHPVPTVGDFVQLLKKHQHSLHKFLHQCAKNEKELTGWFRDWSRHALDQFRQSDSAIRDKETPGKGTGDLTQPLRDLWASLAESKQKELLPALDAHAKRLATLHESSTARLRALLESPSSDPSAAKSKSTTTKEKTGDGNSAAPTINPGPGAFLAKWQDLLDRSPITPSVAEGGKVRTGDISDVLQPDRDEMDVNSGEDKQQDEDDDDAFEDAVEKLDTFGVSQPASESAADIEAVVSALGKAYRHMLSERLVSK